MLPSSSSSKSETHPGEGSGSGSGSYKSDLIEKWLAFPTNTDDSSSTPPAAANEIVEEKEPGKKKQEENGGASTGRSRWSGEIRASMERASLESSSGLGRQHPTCLPGTEGRPRQSSADLCSFRCYAAGLPYHVRKCWLL